MPISKKLPREVESRLDSLSSARHRPKSYYIREAINQYLEENEDTFIALARLETPLPALTLDEVEKRLGLAA